MMPGGGLGVCMMAIMTMVMKVIMSSDGAHQ
eukprot:COSAG04_NODE_304_length_17311_cov_13.648792_12_plen_31_part_00